ncbi:MAG: putative porin, partial [Bdellovibrionota bacterium]
MRAALLLFITLQTVFSAAQAQDAVKWYDRVSFSGDMRLRHEYIDKDEKDNSNHRQRVRVRLKAEGQVEENLKAVLQIASGNSEAVSTNQTLDGGYNNKNVDISLAYLMWTPIESIDVLGGKVKNTLYSPGDSELLFDADLNPEGTTLNWRHKLESGSSFFANAGVYWYDERDAETTPGSDIHQYSAQLGMNLAFDESQLTL